MSDVSCGRQTRVGSASAVSAASDAQTHSFSSGVPLGGSSSNATSHACFTRGSSPWNGETGLETYDPMGTAGSSRKPESARCAIGTSSFPDARPTTSRALETRDGEKRVGGKRAELLDRGPRIGGDRAVRRSRAGRLATRDRLHRHVFQPPDASPSRSTSHARSPASVRISAPPGLSEEGEEREKDESEGRPSQNSDEIWVVPRDARSRTHPNRHPSARNAHTMVLFLVIPRTPRTLRKKSLKSP